MAVEERGSPGEDNRLIFAYRRDLGVKDYPAVSLRKRESDKKKRKVGREKNEIVVGETSDLPVGDDLHPASHIVPVLVARSLRSCICMIARKPFTK